MTRREDSSFTNCFRLRSSWILTTAEMFLLIIASACAAQTLNSTAMVASAQELPNAKLYRPDFHFSPDRNWINDPTGLVFDGSEFHLFNQYNPLGDQWGHMSWSQFGQQRPDLVARTPNRAQGRRWSVDFHWIDGRRFSKHERLRPEWYRTACCRLHGQLKRATDSKPRLQHRSRPDMDEVFGQSHP